MPTLTVDQLRPFSEAIFVAAGASPANATRVTDAMLSANLAGHDSHGVLHIPGYVSEIKRGVILPAADPSVVRETPTTALVSGGWTFGHVGAAYATRLAVAKARAQRVAMVSLIEAHHIGRLGEYGEMAAAEDMIVLVMMGSGHATPIQAPFGGAAPLLGTNPIAVGIPAGERDGVILDFATTVIAGGKIAVALAKGQPLPEGVLIDRHGRSTTDAAAWRDGGAMLPFGGHKGYALALAIEFLGSILAGGATYARGTNNPFNEAGVLFIAIDPGAFRPAAEYGAAADALIDRTKAVPPAEGFREVMVPGEPERRSRAERLRDGIPVPDSTWAAIGDTAATLGVPLPR